MPEIVKSARIFQAQQVHYLRKTIEGPGDGFVTRNVGTIPAGALILKALSGCYVGGAAFSGGTISMTIGTSLVPSAYMTATPVFGSANVFVPLDAGVAMSALLAVDTPVVCRLSGTSPLAGTMEVIMAYIPDNDA